MSAGDAMTDLDDAANVRTDNTEPPAGAIDGLWFCHREVTRAVALQDGDALVIGRGPPADVRIPDPRLSRRHARITRVGDAVFVEDLSSSSGTYVNGERIAARTRLRPHDVVQAGTLVVVQTERAPAPGAASRVLSHEALQIVVDVERARLRAFRRPFAIALVRVEGEGRVARLLLRALDALRPIDRIAVFAQDTLEIFLPECDTHAESLLADLVARATEDGLLVRAALAPTTTTTVTVDALRSAAEAALGGPAHGERPVVVVRGAAVDVLPSASAIAPSFARVVDDGVKALAAGRAVLIVGEPGTRKGRVAGAMHAARAIGGALHVVACAFLDDARLDDALFGDAARGAGSLAVTRKSHLLLDDIAELALPLQARLARWLDEGGPRREGAPSLIAATHRDLPTRVARARFDPGLAAHFTGDAITVAPLRARSAEVLALAQHFLDEEARLRGRRRPVLDDDVCAALVAYEWPGNERELEGVLARATRLADHGPITLEHLPARVQRLIGGVRDARAPTNPRAPLVVDTQPSPPGLRDALRAYERRVILEALARAGDVQTRAAVLLEIPLRTLVHKLKALGIKRASAGYVVDAAG